MIAFLSAAVGLLSAFSEVFLFFFALIPLAAGVGILRKRVWNAYGFALFESAQLAAIPLVLLRAGTGLTAQRVVSAVLTLALVSLFFLAGRSLERAGAERGWMFPWVAVAVLSTVPLIFVEALVIPSGAMEDTLLIGDRILTRVLPRVAPKYGDMVVFRYPIDRRQIFVKRVIGMPGDRIRIVAKTVHRNGAALVEPYAVHKFNSIDSYRDNFPGGVSGISMQAGAKEMLGAREMLEHHVADGEVIVPSGKYFVLGDNRDNSLDSRYWGFLEFSDVIGKPMLIYDSQGESSDSTRPFSTRRIRWNRLFKML